MKPLKHSESLPQIAELEAILARNEQITEILQKAPLLGMSSWYLGAGSIAQTVWNFRHDFELSRGIRDADLVYYDASDLSYEAEDVYIQKANELFSHIGFPVEIRNQARVHLWYENKFGKKINPYPSVEAAIDEWPTTATSLGVRYDEKGNFVVYAPFGLEDLFNLTVRPNKRKITADIYQAKVNRWIKIWPKLTIVPWNE